MFPHLQTSIKDNSAMGKEIVLSKKREYKNIFNIDACNIPILTQE